MADIMTMTEITKRLERVEDTMHTYTLSAARRQDLVPTDVKPPGEQDVLEFLEDIALLVEDREWSWSIRIGAPKP